MSVSVPAILSMLESAARVYKQVRVIAADAALAAGPADQTELLTLLRQLQVENDAGHEALQDTLASLIGEKSGG